MAPCVAIGVTGPSTGKKHCGLLEVQAHDLMKVWGEVLCRAAENGMSTQHIHCQHTPMSADRRSNTSDFKSMSDKHECRTAQTLDKSWWNTSGAVVAPPAQRQPPGMLVAGLPGCRVPAQESQHQEGSRHTAADHTDFRRVTDMQAGHAHVQSMTTT